MTITVQCSCGKQLRAPDSAAGKKAKCPACGLVAALPGGKTDPMGSTADMDPIDLDDKNDSDSLALDAARQVAQSEDLLTAKCPSCGGRIPPNAVVCVQCGHRFRTQTQTKRTAHRPSPNPQSPAGPPQISMNDIFRSPLSGDTFGQAFSIALMYLFLTIGFLVLLFIIVAVTAKNPSYFTAGRIVILMAGLGLYAWLNSQFMNVIEQAANVDGRASGRSPGTDIFFGIAILIITAAPVLLTSVLLAAAHATAEPNPLTSFAMFCSFIWALLYSPMAYAVAATERTINPVRVFQQIKRMFSAYILVLIYIGALIVFISCASLMVLDAAANHARSSGYHILPFVVSMLVMFALFYQAIASCVIMGMLMRRSHYDRGVRMSEFLSSGAWITAAVVCAVMAGLPAAATFNPSFYFRFSAPAPRTPTPDRTVANDTPTTNTDTPRPAPPLLTMTTTTPTIPATLIPAPGNPCPCPSTGRCPTPSTTAAAARSASAKDSCTVREPACPSAMIRPTTTPNSSKEPIAVSDTTSSAPICPSPCPAP